MLMMMMTWQCCMWAHSAHFLVVSLPFLSQWRRPVSLQCSYDHHDDYHDGDDDHDDDHDDDDHENGVITPRKRFPKTEFPQKSEIRHSWRFLEICMIKRYFQRLGQALQACLSFQVFVGL